MRAPAEANPPPLPYMTAEILLSGGFGPDCISLAAMSRKLAAAKAGYARAVLIEIHSAGGEVDEAFRVSSALRHFADSTGPVVAHVARNRVANSAATIVLLAADYIVLDPAASITIHRPSGGEEGARRIAQARLEEVYRGRTIFDAAQISGLLDGCGDTRLDCATALQWGWADEIAGRDRALEVARACARAAPCWPSSVWSPRLAALQVQAEYARRGR